MPSLNCKNTHAQFSMEDENAELAATSERVVELLNEALITKQNTIKNLLIVQELIIYQEPKLLNNFLNEVVSFQNDRKAGVRKFVVTFIEQACKADPNVLPKIIENVIIMLSDAVSSVQKQVIQTATQLYKFNLQWLCSAKVANKLMEATWTSMTRLKFLIFNMLDAENDELKTQIIKFMEAIILAQTFRDEYYFKKERDLSLGDIPAILKFVQPHEMELEAKNAFKQLIAFQRSPYISSYSLMMCMMSLSAIARRRFEFFPKVLREFESLHAKLLPTLEQPELNSIRNSLNCGLISLSKHPAAKKFYRQISTMLSDLGATPEQIEKYFPTVNSVRKQQRCENADVLRATQYDDNKLANDAKCAHKSKKDYKSTAIDITTEDVYSRLWGANVSDLVLVSLLNLPSTMPVQFPFTYTSIVAAGTAPHVRYLARLLATQFTRANLGKGVQETNAVNKAIIVGSGEEEGHSISRNIETARSTAEAEMKRKSSVSNPVVSKNSSVPNDVNPLRVIIPDSDEQTDNLSKIVYERILNAEKCASDQCVSAVRSKILVKLATQFGGNYSVLLKKHIAEDLSDRVDLLFAWLFEEYVAHKGYSGSPSISITKYNETASSLLAIILENEEQKHTLLPCFFMESPCITSDMLNALKSYCMDECAVKKGLQIIKTLTRLRVPMQLDFLRVVLELTLSEKLAVRSEAVIYSVELYSKPTLKPYIKAFALRSLKFLLKGNPPSELILSNESSAWNEEHAKACLHLFMSLLPINHRLVHSLGLVYVQLRIDVQRIILQSLELPVKSMNIHSPELSLFIDSCPKGAETLIMRIVHILTAEAPPSFKLVSHVRKFYQKRLPDIRILIPVISGLSKKEVISVLPELIKLNPIIVKEVFHRLLATNVSSSLNPAELLIALHNINSSKCNLKTVIQATSFCFEERNSFTEVVLAVVIQQLMEQSPLPILLMRTIILSLVNYPQLLGFITNVLKQLIEQKVWKQKKLWEGFIKCCQRTKPRSFQVLLQLPPQQLEHVLQTCPDLQHSLCQHVCNFSDCQKTHIPEDIVKVLEAFSLQNTSFQLPCNESSL